MFIEERQQEIYEHINKYGKITIIEISKNYNVSDETARRDLRILEQKNLCKRTHGGAIKLSPIDTSMTNNRDYRNMHITTSYRLIAEEALNYIKENDVIYITSGSFGYILLQMLSKDIHYTIVVNSVDLGQELRFFKNSDIYIIGGKMRESGSIVDSIALDFIKKLHFDICFLTGSGLTADFGLSNGTDETAAFQRCVINNSRKRILLIPSSKIGKNAFIKVCDVEKFEHIITDFECNEEHISALEDKGVNVIVTGDTNDKRV